MDIFVQSSYCWVTEPALHEVFQQGTQVSILSKDGQATSLPISVLISASSHLKSVLAPSICCSSTSVTISLPSASATTVQLFVKILCQGESEVCGGLDSTMTILGEVSEVMKMLGIGVNVAPVLCSKIASECLVDEGVVVNEEVTDKLDMGEICDLSHGNGDVFDMNSNIEEFYQSGVIKDCEVKLARCRETIDEFDDNEGFTESLDLGSREIIIKCDICGISLPNYQSLRAHIGELHGFQDHMVGKEKKYRSDKNKCPICSLKFSSWGYVLKHFRKKHHEDSRKSGYQCKDCDMKCNNIGNLQRHRQAKHREFVFVSVNDVPGDVDENEEMSVTECGLIATNQEILSPHCQEFHHISSSGLATEKKGPSSQYSVLKCEECRKTFISKSGLRVHIQRHHEDIKYGCGSCDYIAGYRTSIRKHCRRTGHNSSLICKINP